MRVSRSTKLLWHRWTRASESRGAATAARATPAGRARELFLPAVEDLLADAEPATDLHDFFAALDLVQRVDDLFVRAAFPWHSGPPLAGRRRPLQETTDRSFFTFRLY